MNEIFDRILRGTTGNLELRRMVWVPKGRGGGGAYNPPSERLFSRDPRKIERFIKDEAGDVFHGINTRTPGTKTGNKKAVHEIVCFYADIDFKSTSREKFEETLKGFRHRPTIIVDSGKGRHLNWFLKACILLNGDASKVDLIESINRGLGKHFSGDHVHNIDRILRSPDRINSKWPNRPLCKILISDGPEYDLSDLEIYADIRNSTNAKTNLGDVPDEVPARFKELLAKNRVIRSTWNGERSDLKDQSGSGHDLAMANTLVHHGFTPEEIASILRAMPSGKGHNAGQAYLERTISKAFASAGEQHEAPAPPDKLILKEEALHGLAGDIVRAIDPFTESDPIAVLVTFLVYFGNVIGRSAHYRVEFTVHYLNLFIALVGLTAKGRKGTSKSTVRYMLRKVDQEWIDNMNTSGLSSGEGLIFAVRDAITQSQPIKEKGKVIGYQDVITDQGISDKRLNVIEEELSQALKVMSREGNILSAIIRQAWDCVDLHPLTKQNPIRASGAHISILGHITRDELLRHLDETEKANGFANRFIWLVVERSKEIPNPKGVPDRILSPLVGRLKRAVDFGKKTAEMKRDDGAEAAWKHVYHELSKAKPGMLGAVIARAEPLVMRLACLYALLDLSLFVRVEHLSAALALWDSAEEAAKQIFGDSLGDPYADRILTALKESGGMTESEISNLFGRHNYTRVDRALDQIFKLGLAKPYTINTAGRPKTVWRLCAKSA